MLEKILLTLTALGNHLSVAQEPIPKNYFRSPIDTTISLAGNFGELRPNHFHAGLDIRTGNKEKMAVYAVADGYVSRIKVSTYGYGRIIYVTHPNGFVSVYAHLSSFADSIASYMKVRQYEQKTFELELFPKPGELPVKKGELIARSGNTGASGGPHLHFEIREEKTEKAINPLLFGIPIEDYVKPQLFRLKIYPADEISTVKNKNEAAEFTLKNTKAGYSISGTDTIPASGKIYFGLEAFDTEKPGGGKNEVYSVELQKNNKRIFYYEMNKIGFDESRTINSFIDYAAMQKSNRFFQRAFIQPNNKLGIYKDVINNGVVELNADSVYTFKYIVKDLFGNMSQLTFSVQSKPNKAEKNAREASKSTNIFRYDQENKFTSTNFSLSIPANTLFDDIDFQFNMTNSPQPGYYSKIYHVHKQEIPLRDAYTLAIKPWPMDDSTQKHFVLARLNRAGGKEFVGANWQHDSLVCKLKEFGNYFVTTDTIPPVIKPLNILPNKNISRQKTIELKATDNFSGIKSYDAYIDNNWVLMEYEYKQNKFYYIIDQTKAYSPFSASRKHSFKFIVRDKAGNARIYETTLQL